MRLHEEGRLPCVSCDELRSVLLGGRLAAKLRKIKRSPCASCGAVAFVRKRCGEREFECLCKVCVLPHGMQVVDETKITVEVERCDGENSWADFEAVRCGAKSSEPSPSGPASLPPLVSSVSSSSACSRVSGAASRSVDDFFDMLAELPRGPKRFCKKKPQAPTLVYERGCGVVYVGAIAAAEDPEWLR